MSLQTLHVDEPRLTFGSNQKTGDPRDGLHLFGPHEPLAPFSIRAGVVGTKELLALYKSFVQRLNQPFISTKRVYGKVFSDEVARPSFPGFKAVFNIEWPVEPELFLEVDPQQIEYLLRQPNKKKRTADLVELYLGKITTALKQEDPSVNLWFILVPHRLYVLCKPGSYGRNLSEGTKQFLLMTRQGQYDFKFPGEEYYFEQASKLLDSSSDFHHLLKARLIQEKVEAPVQLEVDSTLQFRDKYKGWELDENMKAHLAWTQSTTVYYKLGKLPWKLGDIRDGVCYLGLVFKKLSQDSSKGYVCSAAQMFLKDGDGAVFRGNIGLWQGRDEREFHLDDRASEHLLGMALDDYFGKWQKYPDELFVHGRARFSEDEWRGFSNAVSARQACTKLVGVVIKDSARLKLFRNVEGETSDYGVLRGLALKTSEKEAYLFTRGFIPRLNTSSSLEVPNPLHIQITRGEADLETVLKDVLALTKLNYNACIYGDGLPVTLRFSDNIGNILTATEKWKVDQRQFKYYI